MFEDLAVLLLQLDLLLHLPLDSYLLLLEFLDFVSAPLVFGLLLLVMLIALAFLAVPLGLLIASAVTAKSGGNPNFLLLGLGITGTLVCMLVMMPFLTAVLLQAYEDLFDSAA